jgi:hypothetical protein
LSQADIHPMAPEHLPMFIPAADGSDPLFSFIAIFTIVMILLMGALYFTLHALPEQMAHQSGHTQMQVVGILAILAMFTHNNAFWIVALLLAAFKMPDFLTPIKSIARSLETMRNPDAPDAVHIMDVPEKEH